jgi:hypothetical protein
MWGVFDTPADLMAAIAEYQASAAIDKKAVKNEAPMPAKREPVPPRHKQHGNKRR